jgi:hypothetical protein
MIKRPRARTSGRSRPASTASASSPPATRVRRTARPGVVRPDGVWREFWVGRTAPVAARVGVIRRDWVEPVWGVALFSEFNGGNQMWRDKPAHMLAKVSEALALRKAFPHDLSGLVTHHRGSQGAPAARDRSTRSRGRRRRPGRRIRLAHGRRADPLLTAQRARGTTRARWCHPNPRTPIGGTVIIAPRVDHNGAGEAASRWP